MGTAPAFASVTEALDMARAALPSGYIPVLLTRITSVPECAVSSVGFLWGSGTVSRSCGFAAEAPDWPSRPDTGYPGTVTS